MTVTSNQRLSEKLIAFRRDIHQHPELGWQEVRTCQKISQALAELGIKHRELATTGIIADIPGPAGVPVIALRADIDALPIEEDTNLPFSSGTKGVMHACGHDGHTAMVLGAAELLIADKNLPAPVRLIFQPAEEIGDGAPHMMREGALDNVAMIFGAHIDRQYKAGVIAVTDGVVNASTDTFLIDIIGQGGHAARPHETVDTIMVGSTLVMALQTIVSREINPSFPAVVTVGKFEAGTVSNVIAGRCRLEGTIRCQNETVRNYIKDTLKRKAKAIEDLYNAKINVDLTEGLPCLLNDNSANDLAREAVRKVVGEEGLTSMAFANMGAEDFAFYVLEVPGSYVRIGAQVEGVPYPSHSAQFVFDESCLVVGAEYFYNVAKAAGTRVASNK